MRKIKRTIIMAGKPASGKGTQCEMLVERYGLVHISTGDILRDRAPFMPEVKALMDSGKLVPDEIIVKLLTARLQERDVQENGVIIDGFPRTLPQAKALAEHIKVDHFIFLDTPDEVVMDRIGGRRLDPITKKTYHIKYNPPPPEVADRVVVRYDDTPDRLQQRLEEFQKHILSLLAIYAEVKAVVPAPADLRPALLFENLKKLLEGEEYWGRLIKSKVTVQSGECGSRARSLISIGRYFEHSTWSMLKRGCLSEIFWHNQQAHFSGQSPQELYRSVVVVSQQLKVARSLHLFENLLVECYLAGVSSKCIHLGFNLFALRIPPDILPLTAPSSPSDLSEERNLDGLVATGFATLAFLDPKHDKALSTPNQKHLSALAFSSEPPPQKISFPKMGTEPIEKWRMVFVVAESALDSQGHINQTAWLQYVEDARYLASNSVDQGNVTYDMGFRESALCKLPIHLAKLEFLACAEAGARVLLELFRVPHNRFALGVEVKRIWSIEPPQLLVKAYLELEVHAQL
eukprot:gb/GEZN01005236.1/.p1 GENE.gb/GEZN01005236.1/~~gb/GEZN01005236.1/.p1  ORF type:complete len:518 (+),score=96.73 gb/GEZN01005236.1/:45-1598(+)